ncbi:hypothetical protein BDF22DRAFT_670385 [Syncephalis plumigaleata]|nr:hypothetical protein BDF22DRAFT_670385 [Syncephalis plumigaleata]
MLYDVHCHIIDDDPSQYPLISQLKTQRLCLMGTCPSDWPSVRDMAKQYPEKIQPAFGFHPWFAERDATPPPTTTTNKASSSSSSEHDIWWLPLLRNYLTEHPNAIVGEIGKMPRNKT